MLTLRLTPEANAVKPRTCEDKSAYERAQAEAGPGEAVSLRLLAVWFVLNRFQVL